MAAVAETVWTIAVDHVISFGLGCVVGFVLTNRYRIVKRNGDH